MDRLRLDAVDADDLAILSAYCQDAVIRAEDLLYDGKRQRFVLAMNRFVWERSPEPSRLPFLKRRSENERRRAILRFDRVGAVRRIGVDPAASDQVLVLLALRFAPAETPSGAIELVFAGGSAISLDVECIEVRLRDEDASWSTTARPDHDRPDAPR